MKKTLTIIGLALLGLLSLQSCPPPSESVYTLSPNAIQYLYWDFTDCTIGVTDFEISVSKPRNHQGQSNSLPPSTPLSVDAVDLTTGQVAEHYGNDPFILRFMNYNVSGGVVQLSLNYAGNKPLDVLISTVGNYGGPP